MKLHGAAKAAFLRRMAAGRRKHAAPSKPHAKRRRKTHHKTHHHHSHSKSTKRRPVSHRRRRHHRVRRFARKHGPKALGFLKGLLPTAPEAVSIAAAAVYGKVEGDAVKDTGHILRSVPTPLKVIGRSGNLGLALWILGAVTRQRLVRAAATGVVDVAAYQITRRPEPFGKAGDADVEFKLSGYGRRSGGDRAAEMVDRYMNGGGSNPDDQYAPDGCE